MHHSPLLASRQHNTILVCISRNIVVSTIAQTNHRPAYEIADAEAVFNLDLVFFRGANVLAPNLGYKGFAADEVVDDEDFARGEARAETCYAHEHGAGDGGEERNAGARVGA